MLKYTKFDQSIMKANYVRNPLKELDALADVTDDWIQEFIHRSGGEGRASIDYSVEADYDNDVEFNGKEDLDKLLD